MAYCEFAYRKRNLGQEKNSRNKQAINTEGSHFQAKDLANEKDTGKPTMT